MRKNQLKPIVMGISLLTAIGVSILSGTAGREEAHGALMVAIDETNFPDAVFRNYVGDNFDIGGDGVLQEQEANAVTEIIVNEMGISDLKGIEYFTNLSYLNCKNNNLTAIDISQNTALRVFDCSDNKISTLDVSHNTELTHLDCENILITSLNISSNTKLVRISSEGCPLTSLDVSNNPNLIFLSVAHTNVNAIDVSHNPKLDLLFCGETKISSLDLTHNPVLREVRCGINTISEIDVSKNPKLEQLSIHNCRLTSLDVSNNPLLTEIQCGNNKLTSLDVSHNPELKMLWCEGNRFASLDLSNNPKITKLQHWSFISAPLRKDGTGYSLDLSTCSLDRSKISSVSAGRYDAATGKIYVDTPLSVGDTVTYEYVTGLAGDTMTVTITISEVDPPATTEAPSTEVPTTEAPTTEQPASTSTPSTEAATTTENKDTPKTGDTAGPIGILILGLCSMAGMIFINKKTR